MDATAIGSVADPKAADATSDATAIALLKAILDALGSVAVTGPLTDAQLRAADVKVSLDGESVATTGPLTDVQLRAAAVPVSVSPPATLVHGQKTVATAGAHEALATTQALTTGVRIKALHGNTGYVYVGDDAVAAATGFVLDAGEEVFLEIADLATVFLDVSVNGEGVSYIGS